MKDTRNEAAILQNRVAELALIIVRTWDEKRDEDIPPEMKDTMQALQK